MTSAVLQQATAATDSAASLAISFPTAPTTGSILVLVANSPQGITATPAGWALRASFAGDQGFYIWDKTSAGSGDLSVTVTPDNPAAVALTLLELNAVNVTVFDAHSTVNGTSNANNIPCSSVTTSGLYGADLLAVGALHGWDAVPDPVPTYSSGFIHLATTPVTAVSPDLVAQYVGEKATSAAGASGGTIISQTANLLNTAGFLLAYSRPAPLVIVPITAVTSYTGWTLTGETDALRALTDANDVSQLATGDLNGSTVLIDTVMGSMEKPPASFVVRVRAKRDAATAGVQGKLYDGATLLSTSDTKSPPQGVFGDLLLTFPAVEIAAPVAAKWQAGLRLAVSGTAS